MKKILIIIFQMFLIGNVVFTQVFESIGGKTILQLDGFSVKSPPGDDWEFLISKDKKTVWFRDESFNFLTGEENKTYIKIFKDSCINSAGVDKEHFIQSYLDAQADTIIKYTTKGLKKYDIGVKDIEKNKNFDTLISGKKFYCKPYSLSYSKTSEALLDLNECYLDFLLIVYQPENFNDSQQLFIFDISGSYNQPIIFFDFNSSDLKPIYSILKSFKVDENK